MSDKISLRHTFLAATALLAVAPFAGALNASAASIDVPAGTYQNDPAHSNLLWKVNHFGLSHYYGRLDSIKATLQLDSTDIAKSKLNVTIDPKSVDTNFPAKPDSFNQEIAGEKFFNAEKFPTITFTSTQIEVTGEKTGKVTGDLTFHGVTKPVTLDVTFNTAFKAHPMSKKPALGFSATGQIKRSDFGVDTLVGPVSDEVDLIIEAEFAPAQ